MPAVQIGEEIDGIVKHRDGVFFKEILKNRYFQQHITNVMDTFFGHFECWVHIHLTGLY